LIQFLACARPEPASLAELPAAAEARGVQVEAGAWSASAGAVTLAAGLAQAREVQTLRTGDVPLEIRAAESDWDLRAKSARFRGDVAVVRGPVTLTCTTLSVQYGGKDEIDHILAEGAVEVRRDGRVATAARADLDGKSGRIALTGQPTLVDGPNRLAGEKITLYLDDEKVHCEGGAGRPCHLVVEGSALR
jgi:lipopolysaccharide export system protein LptA